MTSTKFGSKLSSHKIEWTVQCLNSRCFNAWHSWSFAWPFPLHGRSQPQRPSSASCPGLLNHTFLRLQDEKPQSLCQYSGKVILVVNTASYCGFTSQYKGLEALHDKYKDRGLVVLGFPSNDFAQEKATNQEIADFCESTFWCEVSDVHQNRRHRRCSSAILQTTVAKPWSASKVELLQIPDWPRRQIDRQLQQHDQPRKQKFGAGC